MQTQSRVKKVFNYIDIAFFGHLLDDFTVRTDDEQSRPVVELVRVPDVKLAVINASVTDIVPDHGLP